MEKVWSVAGFAVVSVGLIVALFWWISKGRLAPNNTPPSKHDSTVAGTKTPNGAAQSRAPVPQAQGAENGPPVIIEKLPDGSSAFQGPFGICIGPDGHIYVADDLAHRILVFRRDGQFLRVLGQQGTKPGELAWLDAVSLDEEGRLYIADTGNNRIQVWSGDGSFLSEFGRRASDPSARPLRNPRDVLVAAGQHVYVADFNGHCIQVFDRAGKFLKLMEGSGDRKLSGPIQLCLTQRGTLFVAELHNHRIQEIDQDGRSLQIFGHQGSGDGELSAPHGLAIGPDSMLYVADHGNHRIQVFTEEGHYVRSLEQLGASELRLRNPTDLCFDDESRMYIVDKGNRRVLVWSLTR